ncbi:MAG: hypothetical protein CMI74_04060 [Candidatus Pelagibacter sp.]|nr:hypothetical protein [Candidatus Pelagibacter sp.]|tara:strand:- start:7043 stop:7930 length:888 start_codon:yes stop_codon:yes gene_type:complete
MMTQLISYNVTGQAEDVSNIISSISPTATPFQSMIKTEKVHARTFEWLEDSLRTATNTALVEGASSSTTSVGQPTARSNTTQIIGESFAVSATSDAIKTYGRAQQTAYALAKTLKVLKLDLEVSMCGVSQAAVTGDASTARKMASIDQQISTTVDAGGSATDPLTEAKILELGQTLYTAGSEPSVLMIKPADSTIIAGFASSSNRQRDIADKSTLVNTIDVLVTAFGQYKVVLNRSQTTDQAYLIDPSMFKQAVLRPFTRTLLAKTGDSDSHQVIGEFSVKHSNFGDSGRITGLS